MWLLYNVLQLEKLCHRHALSTMWLLYNVLQWFKGVRTEFRELNTGSTTEANHVNRVAMV